MLSAKIISGKMATPKPASTKPLIVCRSALWKIISGWKPTLSQADVISVNNEKVSGKKMNFSFF
ncbi:hypothetical protein BTHER_04389 [Brochothrix thermosphacta DSM 20171 = FSL F6-1036]|nr:hypothetical protein BTHER_04389 [Brochothrix thermosphacta DSM 20171 = FSL F6-1036]